MAITNLVRDYGVDPSIVRMISTDSYSTLISPGYLTSQLSAIQSLNGGSFQWVLSDVVLGYYQTGWALFTISADFTTLNPFLTNQNEWQWIAVNSSPYAMISNNGYVTQSSSLNVLSLPVVSSFGDVISISGQGSGGWKVTQGAGQQIIVDPNTTTSGATGYIASLTRYNSITLLCIVANLTWTAYIPPQATLTII